MTQMAAAMQVAGSLVQGIGGFSAGQANARAYDAAAHQSLVTGAQDEAVVREQARKAIGDQVAAQFSNGFQGGTGSALDYLHESQVNAALDALRVRRQAGQEANAYATQAASARRQSWFDLAGGLLGAATKAITTDWADPRSSTKAAPKAPAPKAPATQPVVTGDGTNMTGAISRVGAYY